MKKSLLPYEKNYHLHWCKADPFGRFAFLVVGFHATPLLAWFSYYYPPVDLKHMGHILRQIAIGFASPPFWTVRGLQSLRHLWQFYRKKINEEPT